MVITIIVLLILAGVAIATLTGESGIIKQSEKAKFFTEIQELDERIKLSNIDANNEFGYINDILNINSIYNDRLEVENGKLVYIEDKFNNTELSWLDELGIEKKNKYYMIMSVETKNNKYKEYTNAGTLANFRDLVNAGTFSTTYDIAYLIEDIDFSEINSGEMNAWVPIGTEEIKFDKIFDGNNNKIENVNINSDMSSQGIFSYNSGTIKNLILNSGTITATTVGGIVHFNEGDIINCANKVNIKASNNSGGIASRNPGEIIASYNEGNIEINGATVGGIVGYNNGGMVNSCYNTGKIDNKQLGYGGNTGGVVGSNTGEIKNCFNKGVVEASSDDVAGICGINHANISNCYNLGNVTNITYATGGIVGYSAAENTILNCINSGDIEGKENVGGILGSAGGIKSTITNSKSNCKLTGQVNVGGIVGNGNINNLTINNCTWYANSEVSFGIGSASSNENAKFVENLQLDNVIDIVNGDNNFKSNGKEVVLNWQ